MDNELIDNKATNYPLSIKKLLIDSSSSYTFFESCLFA